MLSDTLFGLSDYGKQCPTLLVKISTFVGQNVGQTVGYVLALLLDFVRQLVKSELNLIPYFYNSKEWTGWDLNPRPQQCQCRILPD